MEGNFEEHKPGYYTTKLVARIEEFDPDQYGNIWYSVVFEGDAETFMWLAKNEPEEGKKYFGHIEPTRSGKRLRFKTDKLPDDAPRQAPRATQSSSSDRKDQSRDITLGLVYKTFVQAEGMLPQQKAHWDKIVENWQTLLDISAGDYKLPETSGYNKAKAVADSLRDEPLPEEADMPLDWLKDEAP